MLRFVAFTLGSNKLLFLTQDRIVFGFNDTLVRMWDPETCEQLREFARTVSGLIFV